MVLAAFHRPGTAVRERCGASSSSEQAGHAAEQGQQQQRRPHAGPCICHLRSWRRPRRAGSGAVERHRDRAPVKPHPTTRSRPLRLVRARASNGRGRARVSPATKPQNGAPTPHGRHARGGHRERQHRREALPLVRQRRSQGTRERADQGGPGDGGDQGGRHGGEQPDQRDTEQRQDQVARGRRRPSQPASGRIGVGVGPCRSRR